MNKFPFFYCGKTSSFVATCMKKILLLSDTHGYLDEKMEKFIAEADEVWHAGDWGSGNLPERISAIRPLKGVYGNIDGQDIRIGFPLFLDFYCEGVRVWITHIGGYPGRYAPFIREKLKESVPGLLVCGHSHILKVMRDPKYGLLHINPGAAGISGFHQVRTMIRLKFDAGRMHDLEVIELGPRAWIPTA